jgi:hypothetical protein
MKIETRKMAEIIYSLTLLKGESPFNSEYADGKISQLKTDITANMKTMA